MDQGEDLRAATASGRNNALNRRRHPPSFPSTIYNYYYYTNTINDATDGQGTPDEIFSSFFRFKFAESFLFETELGSIFSLFFFFSEKINENEAKIRILLIKEILQTIYYKRDLGTKLQSKTDKKDDLCI